MVWLYSKIYQIYCEHQHRHDKALLVLVSALHSAFLTRNGGSGLGIGVVVREGLGGVGVVRAGTGPG